MEQDIIQNPFVVGRYVPAPYFCDRSEETDSLVKQLENGRNVALISPRRMGKTGLIMHCFEDARVSSRYYTFLVDIYATTSMAEFVFLLGKTIFDALKPRGRQWAERFMSLVGSLRVGFRLDSVTGEPSFELSLGDIHAPETTLDEIFRYLESAEQPCIVAIDEFQQIGTYSESNVEAMLRTKIQRCRRTQFIFSGSRRHVMGQMFQSPSKPFYQSAISLGLGPIPLTAYTEFAQRMFEGRGRSVMPEVVTEVYQWLEGCTWFVQMMMNELFALTPRGGVCGPMQIAKARANVVDAQGAVYREMLSHLPVRQKQVLLAIAKEGTACNVTSSGFVKRHSLPSSSSVQSALRALLAADIVTQEEGKVRIYDYFLADWLVAQY